MEYDLGDKENKNLTYGVIENDTVLGSEELDNLQRVEDNNKSVRTSMPKVLWFVFGGIALAIMLVIFFLSVIRPIFVGPFEFEYIAYLNNKYDDEFYYVSGAPSCVWFNTGECSAVFSSDALNGLEITVSSSHHYDTLFRDNYYEKIYNFDSKNYYHDKYEKVFEEASLDPYHNNSIDIDVNFSPIDAHIKTPYLNSEWKTSYEWFNAFASRNHAFDSFEEFLDALEGQEAEVKIDLEMNVMHADSLSYDKDVFDSLKSNVAQIVKDNNLDITYVNFVVGGFDRPGLCPEEFDYTVRSLGQDINNDYSDWNIQSCLEVLYSKYE